MTLLDLEFEPDATTLGLLGAEHQNGTWVGRELLPIANRIRNQGGCEDDYLHWVMASTLWTSYTYSTGDSYSKQRSSLTGAWEKSEESKPFELDDALADLEGRIREARWPGRAGVRNQTVALAFVGFCRDRNCFTRTLSRYELAKYTPGISPKTVGLGLADLVKIGLLSREDRTDRRSSGRSTRRYRINLRWNVGAATQVADAHLRKSNGIKVSRSTGKHSLTLFCQMADTTYEVDVSGHDIWSRQGLGPTALRVWSLLTEHPGCRIFGLDEPASFYEDDAVQHLGKSADELTAESGLSRRTVDSALAKLFDNCMAVTLPGRPHRWLRATYPPVDPLADELGCAGAQADRIASIERRQDTNLIAYPSSYTTLPMKDRL